MRLLILQKPNVLLIHVNVDETAHRPAIVHQAFPNAWEPRLEFRNRAADSICLDLDEFFVVGELPERSGNAYFCGHNQN